MKVVNTGATFCRFHLPIVANATIYRRAALSEVRQVLECASPLALFEEDAAPDKALVSELPARPQSGSRLPHSKTLRVGRRAQWKSHDALRHR